MNERGFFNVVGLCLLIVTAISIIGIHESEGIFSYGARNLQIEYDLKNAADSELVKALVDIDSGAVTLKIDPYGTRKNRQTQISKTKIDSGTLEDVSVEVWAEYGNINELEIISFINDNKVKCNKITTSEGVVLISVASFDDNYQSSMAYVLYDDQNKKYQIDEINYINSTTLTVENTFK